MQLYIQTEQNTGLYLHLKQSLYQVCVLITYEWFIANMKALCFPWQCTWATHLSVKFLKCSIDLLLHAEFKLAPDKF